MYCDGGNSHPALKHLKELQALHDKGVGIGCIHYAVEPGDENKKGDNGRAEFLDWIGGYFETFYSINPHWTGRISRSSRSTRSRAGSGRLRTRTSGTTTCASATTWKA